MSMKWLKVPHPNTNACQFMLLVTVYLPLHAHFGSYSVFPFAQQQRLFWYFHLVIVLLL